MFIGVNMEGYKLLPFVLDGFRVDVYKNLVAQPRVLPPIETSNEDPIAFYVNMHGFKKKEKCLTINLVINSNRNVNVYERLMFKHLGIFPNGKR